MKPLFAFILLSILSPSVIAQTDTEFPKEFIMHIKMHNGMVSKLNASPDVYIGGLQVIPQYTIVENLLRGGIAAGGYYTGKSVQASIGPTVSIKIKSFNVKPFGGAGNLHLNFDHLWGTNREKLIGGGINADLLNRLVLGLSVHRDYSRNSWWFQNGLSWRMSKVKKSKDL